MIKRWISPAETDRQIVQQLADALAIDYALAQLLVQRGVRDFAGARSFFRPQIGDLHNPFLMQDMDKAVARIEAAMAQGQKIMVYGDYDVDGTTAVAMVYAFFKSQGAAVTYCIPDRYIDGYGVAYRAIDEAKQMGVSLIITLDCGIKAMEKVAYAAERGIDFIICDHHLPSETLPQAVAVLDPQRTDCSYPYKELSGCGVGFKLLQAYCQKNNIPFDAIAHFLDLLVVSIASDLVPITGENRTLAYFGLQHLNTHPRKGLQSIINIADLAEQPIAVNDIVFRLGPRINAAGRMESGATAVDLLLSESDETAKSIGNTINTQNTNRKNIDRSITQEAIVAIKQQNEWQNQYGIVAFNPQWHKGVVGIVASRLVEEFYRPSIVLTQSDDKATGSARSIAGFDLYQAIESCADLLTNFGGHIYAAGLTMPVKNVEKFKERFEAAARQTISPEMLIPQIEIEAEINFRDITPKFFRILKQYQPFGPGNMSPVFVTRNVLIYNKPRIVGNTAEHLKLDLIQQDVDGLPVTAIAFGLAHHYKYIAANNPFDICYTITENYFQGKTTLQLNIKDIKPSEAM
ncbi:single-stranded-DNA-specific exonuclease RecJ [Bacteroidia bacterium]|nr:single-stranded-DNA-specific exonuclease RecJ [Bacteroidia bacterium]GHT81804.1 single-stranded-DNA-specific exonuclease RecJ [Bacteroidia bacterium]